VPAGDADALAVAPGTILLDRDLAERMGSAERARALSELTIDAMWIA
jgi:glycosyltransferase involved in cell wall biosynthesis